MHTIDPDCLPETEGTLERFLLNPHGELDGMLLHGGVEVHFPPHMGDAVEALATLGEVVRVRGFRPRGAAVIAAVRVQDARGEGVTDSGPTKHASKHEREKARRDLLQMRQPCVSEGTIVCLLHGPKGEVRGALLENGTILRWPPRESERFTNLLHPGGLLAARGVGLATRFGTVVEVSALGASANQVKEFDRKPKDGSHDPDSGDRRPAEPA